METYDPRIDAYIEKSAAFARPILKHLRELMHHASPDIKETIKWGMPFFDQHGTVSKMAAFKQHCSFGFWKSSLMDDPANLRSADKEGMGLFGRICTVADLPDDSILITYIQNAVRLNIDGVKKPVRKPATKSKELQVPDYFSSILNEHPAAQQIFENFNYSHRKEYVEWITEAKTEATRQKRIETAVEWLTEGKSRMWKYEKK
jgi:uncharacterized protein YdeI (YjbR/CyaY-like superfamily)